jgi:hypothetical protein
VRFFTVNIHFPADFFWTTNILFCGFWILHILTHLFLLLLFFLLALGLLLLVRGTPYYDFKFARYHDNIGIIVYRIPRNDSVPGFYDEYLFYFSYSHFWGQLDKVSYIGSLYNVQ